MRVWLSCDVAHLVLVPSQAFHPHTSNVHCYYHYQRGPLSLNQTMAHVHLQSQTQDPADLEFFCSQLDHVNGR